MNPALNVLFQIAAIIAFFGVVIAVAQTIADHWIKSAIILPPDLDRDPALDPNIEEFAAMRRAAAKASEAKKASDVSEAMRKRQRLAAAHRADPLNFDDCA